MPDKELTPAEIARNREMTQHLKSWIRHRGLTQEYIAIRMEVSEGTVSKWLKGSQSMTVGQFTALAVILGASPAELLFPPDDVSKAEAYERVTGILSDLDPAAAEQWLRVGEAMIRGRPKKV